MYSSVNIYVEYFIGFIISILIARTLGPDDYGSYSYFVSLAGIAIIFTNAGINTGAIKFIAEARASDSPQNIPAIHAFFARMQRLKTAVVCVLMSAILYLKPDWFLGEGSEWLLSLLVAAVIFKSAHMFRVGVFKGFERFDLLAFSVLIVAPSNLLVIAIANYLHWELLPFLSVYGGVCLLYWLISTFFLRQVKTKMDGPLVALPDELSARMKHHLKVVSINSVLAGLAIGQCEVLLLKQMVGNEAVSFFNIAMSISAAAMLLVPGIYSSVLFPVIARAVADVRQNAMRRINESSRYLFTLGMLVAVPTFQYGEEVVGFLYGEEFKKAGWVLSVFVLFATFKVFLEPFSAYLMSSDRQTILLRLSVFTLIAAWVSNYILIDRYALDGAVYARILMTILIVTIYLAMWKKFLKVLPDIGKFLRVMLIALIAGTASSWLVQDLSGIWLALAGYVLFGILFLLMLVGLNGLSDKDYELLTMQSKRLGEKPSKVVKAFIAMRIKV